VSSQPAMPGEIPPPAPPFTQSYPTSSGALNIKVRCGGAVHEQLPEDEVAAEPGSGSGGHASRPLTQAGLATTDPALCCPIFGPHGLAPLSDKDRFVDLGCGHGHILLAARKAAPGCQCIGVESDAGNVDVARAAAAAAVGEDGNADPIVVFQGNIDDCFPGTEGPDGAGEEAQALQEAVSLAQATVVCVYLDEWSNLKLRPVLLRTLPVGARVLTRYSSTGDAWPSDAEAYGSDGKTLFRLHHVTAARKADQELRSDSECARRYGIRWLQPPNYLGRGPSAAGGAGTTDSEGAGAGSGKQATATEHVRPSPLDPALHAAAPAPMRGLAGEWRRRAAGRGPRAGEFPAPGPRPVFGWCLVLGAVFAWVVAVHVTLVAKVLPATGIDVFDWMREDTYFCHLLPMLIPSIVIFRYWGWLSMELFKNA